MNDIEATRKMLKRVCRVIENLYNIDGYDCIDRNFSQEALNIVYTSKEFQLFSELFDDSRFKFVGPSLLPEDREEASCVVKGPGEKLIYISLGSVFSNAYDYTGFYRNCFEAFGASDLKVALSVGNADPGALGEIPPNFTVRAFFPQLSILAQADLFISHAGINSVQEALYFDVPLIAIPQGWDQFLVAGRVEELGAGIYLRDFQFTASELKRAAAEIFSDKSYRENSRKVGATLRNAGGYRRAADEIMAFKMRGQN
ncbi:MAG: hypothetical protein K6U80_04755 [Firmicutes bacterium]|nr:hypothetical protein [Bacillota bacterium]